MKGRTLFGMIPRNGRDKFTLLFFILGVPFSIWFELKFVVVCSEAMLKVHILATTYLVIQVYWNLFYMLRTDTTTQSLQPGTEDSYPYSIMCEKCGKSPPRSHHCKVCNVCILKRDHHCWFAGYCAGYRNHRYYLITIIYCWIAGFYANIVHFPFMVNTLGLSFRTLVSMVAPHFLWVFGYYTSYEFFIAAIFDMAIYFMLLLTWLIFRQFSQIIHGQTAFERNSKTMMFDKGLFKNLEEVLGDRWYLTWIAPSIDSQLPPLENHWMPSKDKDS